MFWPSSTGGRLRAGLVLGGFALLLAVWLASPDGPAGPAPSAPFGFQQGGPPGTPAGAAPAPEWISAAEAELRAARGAALIDIRSRNDWGESRVSGAVRIPFDELGVRAAHELDRSRPVIVDCFEVAGPLCSVAAVELAGLGFEAVVSDSKPVWDLTCER